MDEPPLGTLGIGEGERVLDQLVSMVCYYTIGDPPGSAQDAYVRDDAGIWRHGYGFTQPELGEPGFGERRLRLLDGLARLFGLRHLRGRP